MIARLGFPGTGKSWFARQAQRGGPIAVACVPPDEQSSYEDRTNIVDLQVFNDDDWLPKLDSFKATAFIRLLRWLRDWKKRIEEGEPLFAVVIDNMSYVSDLAMQDVLADYNADSPRNMPNSFDAYHGHNSNMTQFVNLSRSFVPLGVHVIHTWHVEMREQEGAGEAKVVNVGSKFQPKEELQWEERLLPTMHGKMRQRILGEYAIKAYSELKVRAKLEDRYRISCVPGRAATGAARVQLKDGVDLASLPNDVMALLDAIRKG